MPTSKGDHHMPRRRAFALLVCLAAVTACGSSSVPAFQRPPTGPLCGWRDAPPATYKHVVWLLQENTSESDVIGNGDLPLINGTLVPQCGLATNYHNVSHGSLPNYLGLTSGTGGGSREAGNCQPADCPQTQPNLFEQVQAAGGTWGEYARSMTSKCDPVKDSNYEPEHAVPVYYTDLRSTCQSRDVPLGDPGGGALRAELDRGRLPTFTFITPDGDTESGAGGDRWLGDWITLIAASPAYRSGDTAIFVTWDEGGGSDKSGGESCADSAHADVHAYPSCWVATLVISPSTRPGMKSGAYFNHYSLLRTTEDMLGLNVRLGHAADERTVSMRSAFNL
ncbi:MAG: hypothetical protein E6I76_15265 [Chloroflexi bacterium]|nr:MAG: hypothetical protein E6I76_15265 [Chloroflexota bacterium]